MKFTVWHALTAIVILIVFAAVGYLFVLNGTLNTENIRLAEQKRYIERELDELSKRSKAIETQFADAKNEKEALVNKVNGYEAKIEEIRSESEVRMKDQEAELNKMKALLAQRDKDIPVKDAQIISLKEALRNGNEKIARLTKHLGRAFRKFIKNGGVTLQSITLRSEQKKVAGKVLEVNHDHGFLVVDVGARDGINNGDTLYVLRGDELLGKVVVERTSDEICVAKILYKSLGDEVKKGDSVRN